MISPQLIQHCRKQFQLDWLGVHGVRHWARVRINGLRLAARTGAHTGVIECFAFLHDVCRIADHGDCDHGQRAAAFVRGLPSSTLRLDRAASISLEYAIAQHTNGTSPPDVTVATCWDADRLDLGRISVRPKPQYLFTAAAKDSSFIEECWIRSRARHPPSL